MKADKTIYPDFCSDNNLPRQQPAPIRLCRLSGAILGLLLSSACVTTSSLSPSDQQSVLQSANLAINGRFSFKQEQQAVHGRFEWQHDESNDSILLSGPTGQGVAELNCNPQQCQMTTAGGDVRQSRSSAELMQSLLGVAFPIDQVIGWLQGKSQGADKTQYDGQTRLIQMWRAGWRIDYEYEGDSRLPWLLLVNNSGDIEVRLRIESWSTADDQASAAVFANDEPVPSIDNNSFTGNRLLFEPDYR